MPVGWTTLVDWQGENDDEAVRALPPKVEEFGTGSWVVPPVPVHEQRIKRPRPDGWLWHE